MHPLLESARRLHGQMIEWRRDFHRHPELGYEEHRTSAKVAEHLRSLGLEVRTGVGRTGVVGLLRGERDGPTILLRADMDALPIPEADKGIDYMSGAEGKAHLCGHDAHTGMLMGAAQILKERGWPIPCTIPCSTSMKMRCRLAPPCWHPWPCIIWRTTSDPDSLRRLEGGERSEGGERGGRVCAQAGRLSGEPDSFGEDRSRRRLKPMSH